MPLDGLLVIDKPSGPTSHDVVARVRRILGEQRVGHTGTLDPMASGVLPLAIGRATRLVRFLDADAKRYEATVRLGSSTDTYDALGRPIGDRYEGRMPSRDEIDRALDAFRGTFLQQPPAFSAKKIDGRRSYRLARAHARAAATQSASLSASPALPTVPASPVLPAPARVTAQSVEVVSTEADLVILRIVCSGGFYVRSLAHDLGQALGIGGHLTALCRTEAAGRTLAEAVPLAAIEQEGRDRTLSALIPLPRMLPRLPSLALTADGARRAASGCHLSSHDVLGPFPDPGEGSGRAVRFRLFDPAGNLLGIAERSSTPELLHPAVILV